MNSSRLNTKAANCSVLAKREDATTTYQGKMQRGRFVRHEPVAIQISAASDTSQQTTTNYTAAGTNTFDATRKMVIIRKSSLPEINMASTGGSHKPAEAPAEEFKNDVYRAVENLRVFCKKNNSDKLQCLMRVIATIQELQNDKRASECDDNYIYIKHQLSPFYNWFLGDVLEILSKAATKGCTWEYPTEFFGIFDHLEFLPQNNTTDQTNGALLKYIYNKFIENEMNFLRHIRNDSLLHAARYSADIIDRLILCGKRNKLMTSEWQAKINKEKEQLLNIIDSNRKNSGIDYEDEELTKLEKEVSSGNADSFAKRKYHEILKLQITKLKAQSKIDGVSIQERIDILEKLLRYYDTLVTHLTGPHPQIYATSIPNLMVGIIKSILASIKEENSAGDACQLKEGQLKFISDLMNREWITEKCKRIYIRLKEEMAILIGTRHGEWLDEMHPHIEDASKNHLAVAAESLKRIIDQYINFKESSHGDHESIDNKMEKYRPQLMAVSQYAYIITDDDQKFDLIQAACSAWHNDLVKLLNKDPFTEDDINLILHLKHLAPDVPNICVRKLLESVLAQLFWILLRDGVGSIPIENEKISELGAWVEDLHYVQPIRKPELKKYYGYWKRLTENTKSEGDVGVDLSETPSDSNEWLKKAYGMYCSHTIDGYMRTANFLNSIMPLRTTPEQEDLSMMNNFLYRKLFKDTADKIRRLSKEYDNNDHKIYQIASKYINVFYQNKDILFVLSDDTIRRLWRAHACVAAGEIFSKLEKKDLYDDGDLIEITDLSQIVGDMPYKKVRSMALNAITRIFDYWLNGEGKQKLSLTHLHKISSWLDQPTLREALNTELVDLHDKFKLACQTTLTPGALQEEKIATETGETIPPDLATPSPYIPKPTAKQPSPQPVSVSYATSITQLPVEVEPHSIRPIRPQQPLPPTFLALNDGHPPTPVMTPYHQTHSHNQVYYQQSTPCRPMQPQWQIQPSMPTEHGPEYSSSMGVWQEAQVLQPHPKALNDGHPPTPVMTYCPPHAQGQYYQQSAHCGPVQPQWQIQPNMPTEHGPEYSSSMGVRQEAQVLQPHPKALNDGHPPTPVMSYCPPHAQGQYYQQSAHCGPVQPQWQIQPSMPTEHGPEYSSSMGVWQEAQVLQPHPKALNDGHPPTPVMTPYHQTHSHNQVYYQQTTHCRSMQPQWQIQPSMPTEHGPEYSSSMGVWQEAQVLQPHPKALNDGHPPTPVMTPYHQTHSHNQVYYQQSTPCRPMQPQWQIQPSMPTEHGPEYSSSMGVWQEAQVLQPHPKALNDGHPPTPVMTPYHQTHSHNQVYYQQSTPCRPVQPQWQIQPNMPTEHGPEYSSSMGVRQEAQVLQPHPKALNDGHPPTPVMTPYHQTHSHNQVYYQQSTPCRPVQPQWQIQPNMPTEHRPEYSSSMGVRQEAQVLQPHPKALNDSHPLTPVMSYCPPHAQGQYYQQSAHCGPVQPQWQIQPNMPTEHRPEYSSSMGVRQEAQVLQPHPKALNDGHPPAAPVIKLLSG